MNGTQNLNIDSQTLDQCLKSISNFGSTTYQNICTGQTYSVGWGGLDWVGIILLLALGSIVVIFIMVGLLKIIFDC